MADQKVKCFILLDDLKLSRITVGVCCLDVEPGLGRSFLSCERIMPLAIGCGDLQAGMRLAEAFMMHGRMMLPGGKVLGQAEVHLVRQKFPGMVLRIFDPVLDSLVEFEDDSQQRKIATEATSRVSKCMTEVQGRFSSRADLTTLDFNAVRSAAAGVLDFLKGNPVSFALLSRCADQNNYLAEHSGNVFYLSMLIGSSVRDYVYRERCRQSAATLSGDVALNLLPLGLGAMFIDLGMLPLKDLYTKKEPLTADERNLVREHPIAGAEMLPESLPPGVKMIVKTHHENYDGSGYPNRTPGSTQHVFTRIVRIADAFDAATSTHAYKQAKSSAKTLWEMCNGPYRTLYDPVLMKVMRSLIQPFPIGAKIRLKDGRYAVVVKYNKSDSFCPSAIIAYDENGAMYPKDRLKAPLTIGENNTLRLANFAGEDLSFIYEDVDLGTAPPIEQRAEFDTMFSACFP